MNLTDLQVELRSIEERIAKLHFEIEKMKPKPEEEKKADFETITKLAKQHMITDLRISSASEVIRKQFVSSLSYLLLTEEKDIYERLLYLCRISQGCGLNLSAEDIYKAGLEFEFKDMKELCTDLQEYKYSYLVEAFTIANLSEESSTEILTVIADIAKLMECDKEEIQVIGQVAKSRLLDDSELLKRIPRPSKNRWSGMFVEYISEQWLEKKRIHCKTICIDKYRRSVLDAAPDGFKTEHPCVIKDRLPCGSVVQKGDTLLKYDEKVITSEERNNPYIFMLFLSQETTTIEERNITAPCDGIVFYAEYDKKGEISDKMDKYIAVFVVSYFDEYASFCKWYAEKNTLMGVLLSTVVCKEK